MELLAVAPERVGEHHVMVGPAASPNHPAPYLPRLCAPQGLRLGPGQGVLRHEPRACWKHLRLRLLLLLRLLLGLRILWLLRLLLRLLLGLLLPRLRLGLQLLLRLLLLRLRLLLPLGLWLGVLWRLLLLALGLGLRLSLSLRDDLHFCLLKSLLLRCGYVLPLASAASSGKERKEKKESECMSSEDYVAAFSTDREKASSGERLFLESLFLQEKEGASGEGGDLFPRSSLFPLNRHNR